MRKRIISLLLYIITFILFVIFVIMVSSETERQLTNYYALIVEIVCYSSLVLLSIEIIIGMIKKEEPPTNFVFLNAYVPIIACNLMSIYFILNNSEYILLRHLPANIMNFLLVLLVLNGIAKLIYMKRQKKA